MPSVEFTAIPAVVSTTTDATPLAITLWEVPGSAVVTANLSLAAIAADGTAWGAQVTACYKRVGNANAQAVGVNTILLNQRDLGAALWTAVLSLSGNNIIVTVTGQAGVTIDWGVAGMALATA